MAQTKSDATNKKSRHKQKVTAQAKTPWHKQKLNGTNKNSTAQAKTPRHKQKLHGTNKNSTAQTK
jgi:hypothetical protein